MTLTEEDVANAKQRVTLDLNAAANIGSDHTDAAEELVAGNTVTTTHAKVAAVANVTLKDVQAVAKEIFTPANRNLITVGNLTNAVTLSQL